MLRTCAASLLSIISQPAHSSTTLKLFSQKAAAATTGNQLSSCDQCIRSFFTSPTSLNDNHLYIEDNLKLDVKSTEETTVVDVIPVSTGRKDKLVKVDQGKACVLCSLNLTNLNYTDVMILGQFVKRNGSLVTYHESKLCTRQYKKIEKLISQAQRCNLMPRPADYLVPGAWHELNTYLEPDRKRDQPMKYVKKEYWKM